MIEPLLEWLTSIAHTISLEGFVIVGSFLEEIVAPIPSPFVMTQAAVLAKVQNYNVFNLAVIILLASFVKTISSYLVYFITDKAEDVVIGKYGKYFGVSHKQIEKIGSFLTKSWWDDVLLFLSRAIPLVPTSLVTIAAGVIKYNVRSFLLMTFLGMIVRNLFYLWVGYFGWTYINQWKDQFVNSPLFLIAGVIALGVFVVGVYKAKDKLWDKIMESKEPKKEEK